LNNFSNLKTFIAVAQHHSFAEAARQLHVVPSVVAKRIAQLEGSLGVRLFERTTRSVKLTEAGERLKNKASPVLLAFNDLLSDPPRDETQLAGHIRIMAPTTLTTLYLGPLLTEFLKAHERITLEIALGDRSINPTEDAFDMVISGRVANYEGVEQFPLAPIHYLVCASPSYLKKHPAPKHPTDLLDHSCLVFEPTGKSWIFQSTRGTLHVEVSPRLTADDNNTLLSAAINGLGIAMLPAYIAQSALRANKLKLLLAEFPTQNAWFKAFIPKRKTKLKRVIALQEWLLQEMKLTLPNC
jgi:DNA-binding transcriptional LysR family regulator